jgi:hypothetical protein
MGEYARFSGTSIKIGTCESMYYLRADQARMVEPESGSVDPVRDAEHIRFRFPFPDEDAIAPGGFEDYNRRIRLDGMRPPAELAEDHYSVQFHHDHGYNLSVRCPESVPNTDAYGMRVELPDGLVVHRNGFRGAVFLSQQVYHEGMLVPVLSCACGMAWRLCTLEDAADLLAALDAMDKRERRSYVDALPDDFQTRAEKIAARVRQGFEPGYVAELFGVAV